MVTYLQPQHWEGWGKRTFGLRPAWATLWDLFKNKTKKIVLLFYFKTGSLVAQMGLQLLTILPLSQILRLKAFTAMTSWNNRCLRKYFICLHTIHINTKHRITPLICMFMSEITYTTNAKLSSPLTKNMCDLTTVLLTLNTTFQL